MRSLSVALAELPVGQQLLEAGVLGYLYDVEIDGERIRAKADATLMKKLRNDDRFLEGILHGLHPDVGPSRRDFRSVRGSLGAGSLQIVYDPTTTHFYADVDHASPYDDVVGFVWHAGEVIGGWWRKLRNGR